MNHVSVLFLACILAGFALIKVATTAAFLSSLSSFIVIVGALVVLVFALAIIYQGLKSLTKL
ncbi:putative membrane protein [Bacillus sp. SORGH_AS 510]|uniref:hypothetical protein n=1 Tax=Bacillus sp. SORGH_AS_0510 TaxID=3041771 RepID=UPI0027853CAC|nr:hypothetical protein [Bacillus sp. SORGH_AS_0510]MDQ1147232.1 putative membrane protein [Bacillus sp. SORGH_AS_0510]